MIDQPLIPQLRTYGVCENCDQPAHTDSEPSGPHGGRGWIHTGTSTYTCPFGQGMVSPMWTNSNSTALDDAYNEGHGDGHNKGREQGDEEGRAEMLADVDEALKNAIDELVPEADRDDVEAVVRDVLIALRR